MAAVVAAAAAEAAAVRGAPADTDDAAAVPDDAAGIQWAKTAVEDNALDGPATEVESVLWGSPADETDFKHASSEQQMEVFVGKLVTLSGSIIDRVLEQLKSFKRCVC